LGYSFDLLLESFSESLKDSGVAPHQVEPEGPTWQEIATLLHVFCCLFWFSGLPLRCN